MIGRTAIMLLLFLALIGNLIQTQALQNIRTVDFIRILAAGALLGVMVVSIGTHFRNKKSGQ